MIVFDEMDVAEIPAGAQPATSCASNAGIALMFSLMVACAQPGIVYVDLWLVTNISKHLAGAAIREQQAVERRNAAPQLQNALHVLGSLMTEQKRQHCSHRAHDVGGELS